MNGQVVGMNVRLHQSPWDRRRSRMWKEHICRDLRRVREFTSRETERALSST